MMNNMNENGINEKTAKIVIAIIFIALLVFGAVATIFGIQSMRDYNDLTDRYYELMDERRELRKECDAIYAERYAIEDAFNTYKIKHNEGSDCDHDDTRACLKVSEEYLKEFLYNSYETVYFGEESRLNNTIDKLFSMMEE